MRLQLDSASAGTESSRSAGVGQPGGPGNSLSDSRRVGSGGSSEQDQIHISGPSSALNRINVDRVARIEQLATAVQGGIYNIPSARISAAMVQYAVSGSSETK